MTKIRGILFDLDGTIVDTEVIAERILREELLNLGLEVNDEDVQIVTGRTWEAGLSDLFDRKSMPISKNKFKERVETRYRSELPKRLNPIKGVIEALDVLSKEWPIGIVSGSSRHEIQIVIDGLNIGHAVKFFLGSEDYLKSKPAPDAYLAGLDELSKREKAIKPSEVLVFEDSTPGIESAKSAGTQVVAVSIANHHGHDQSGAQSIIRDFSDVSVKWIKDLEFGSE